MPFGHLTPELLQVLITIAAFFLIGLPLIARRVRLPASNGMKIVPPDAPTPHQRELFRRIDADAAQQGFRPLGFVTSTTLDGKNLCRFYESLTDSTTLFVAVIGSHTGDRGVISYQIISRLTDGTFLSTSNRPVSSVFAPMPHIHKQSVAGAGLGLVAELHRQRLSGVSSPLWRRETLDELLQRMESEHVKFVNYQVERGFLKQNPKTGYFHATYRTGLAGISNFLNPFSDNFTLKRLAAGLLFGTLPAALAIYYQDLLPGGEHLLVYFGYLIGAIGVALSFRHKVFLWTILLLYPVSYLDKSKDVTALIVAAFLAHRLARALLLREAKKLGVAKPATEQKRAA
jgi:hypothetical protein